MSRGGLSAPKQDPAELDNVDQLIYDTCGRRRLQVSAWLQPADAAAPLLDGRKGLTSCSYAIGQAFKQACVLRCGANCAAAVLQY